MSSIYKPSWEQLKAHPNADILFSVPEDEHYTFKRMVQKVKWLDKAYKASHPRAKLVVKDYTATSLVMRLVPFPI